MDQLVGIGMLSQRRACLVVGIHRSVARHQSQRGNDSELRERLKELATQYPRYGYELLYGMLKAEGLVVNEMKTYRICREEKLQARRKRRKRLLARARVPMPISERSNQRWSMDFVSDQLATGRRFRVLNVVDDYSREPIGQIVDTSITGERVSRLLDQIVLEPCVPETIVTDHGPEFTSKATHLWSSTSGCDLALPSSRASRSRTRW